MIRNLIKIADKLDHIGLYKEAEQVDRIIKKISNINEANIEKEYKGIMQRLYSRQFAEMMLMNDRMAASHLCGSSPKYDASGNLIIKYAESPNVLIILGLVSKTDRVSRADAPALKGWMEHLKSKLDEGKTVHVSVNNYSRPLFDRILNSGDYNVASMGTINLEFGTWETLMVRKKEDLNDQFDDEEDSF